MTRWRPTDCGHIHCDQRANRYHKHTQEPADCPYCDGESPTRHIGADSSVVHGDDEAAP
jgi:hypothetical protein